MFHRETLSALRNIFLKKMSKSFEHARTRGHKLSDNKDIEHFLALHWGKEKAKSYLEIKKIDRRLTKISTRNIVAEIGAGLCLDILSYAKADRSTKYVAVDLKKEDLLTAKKWAKTLGVEDQIDFCVSSALALPLRHNSVDVTISYSAVEHLPKRELTQQWANEMSRITRIGGTATLTTSNKLWPTYLLLQKMNRFKLLKNMKVDDEFFYHPREIQKILEKAGLRSIMFGGKGLYYYDLVPPFLPGASYLHQFLSKAINSFENYASFQVLCGRIGFRAVKPK